MSRRTVPACVPIALVVGTLSGGWSGAAFTAGAEADAVHRSMEQRTGPGAGRAPQVEQPRAFGRVLGDVLTQRVRLADERGELELTAVPPAGRVDDWLERLPPRPSSDARGQRWLELSYQLVNSPEVPRVIELPALELVGGDDRALRIEPWPISVGPLAPASPPGTGELLAMRPDRLPPPIDTGPYAARARLAALILVATLLGWLGWWLSRRRRDAVRLPFARAWHEIRTAGGGTDGATRDTDPRAWEALHAALNRAAGHVAGAASLDELLARQPWLAPSRARIEAFFAASAARFFEQPPRPVPFALGELARELYRAERRHAR